VSEDSCVLTGEELEIIKLLADVWDKFGKLPVQHPSHALEFSQDIHRAQRMIMARSAARQMKWDIRKE